MIKRILLALLLMFVLPVTSQAWDGHDLITYYALRDIPELDEDLVRTDYQYETIDQSVYNPDFQVEYRLGESPKALDVLVTYAPEPDWDMDTELELDSKQALTGGSQGWRHQRYTLFANGWIVLGVADERVEHFYDLALYAHQRGDHYWAVRFLARALHFLQDMGQPFHALPMPVGHFLTRHRLNIGNATVVGENVHYNLEYFVEYFLHQGKEELVDALSGDKFQEIDDVRQAAIDLNLASRSLVLEQYNLVLDIWPELSNPQSQVLHPDEYFVEGKEELLEELWEIIEASIQLTAEYSRGLVIKFLQDTQEIAAH